MIKNVIFRAIVQDAQNKFDSVAIFLGKKEICKFQEYLIFDTEHLDIH